MSLSLTVLRGKSAEAEANQVGKKKTRNSCGSVSDRPLDFTARNLRQQRAMGD
jgi:hypothetical protein